MHLLQEKWVGCISIAIWAPKYHVNLNVVQDSINSRSFRSNVKINVVTEYDEVAVNNASPDAENMNWMLDEDMVRMLYPGNRLFNIGNQDKAKRCCFIRRYYINSMGISIHHLIPLLSLYI